MSSNDQLRRLPSVDALASACTDAQHDVPVRVATQAARDVIDEARAAIRNGRTVNLDRDCLADRTAERARRLLRPPLPNVINATGILIHTGLGRSPLAARAAEALVTAASGYCPVELDMDTGQRGKRSHLVRDLLTQLTGAASATVVNNNAAALLLTLAELAKDRSVIVSRGEMIEIGGSFRLPEVMRAGGAILREVGTTNRTRLGDYEDAIGPSTAVILKVHPSNYRVEGFTEGVPIAELAALGKQRGVVVVDDIGSGLLTPSSHPALACEPSARESIEAGADLVLFSGDKILGGPQCGVIIGTKELIDRVESNPMMRAMRVGKLTLAALAATLQLYRDHGPDTTEVRLLAMLHAPIDSLRVRAETVCRALSVVGVDATIVESIARLGGGAAPMQEVASIALRVEQAESTATVDDIATRLRRGDPPVIARTHDGAVTLDLRTVDPSHDAALVRALGAAIETTSRDQPDSIA